MEEKKRNWRKTKRGVEIGGLMRHWLCGGVDGRACVTDRYNIDV